MAFTHGKNAKLYANGYDLTTFFKSVESAGEAETADSTGLGGSDHTHIVGHGSATISGEGMVDNTAAAAHPVLTAALGSSNIPVVHLPAGDTLAAFGLAIKAHETKYAVPVVIDDIVKCSFEAISNVGLDPVQVCHALGAETTTGDKTAADGGAATTTGWRAYFQVTAFTGTNCTVKLIDSANNSTFADVSGGSFAQITAARSVEVLAASSSTATLRQYVGVNLAGTFSSITFSVVVARRR
jgi:hypothetical protein